MIKIVGGKNLQEKFIQKACSQLEKNRTEITVISENRSS